MKINYSVNGVKKWIAPDVQWWNKNWKYAAGVVVALVLLFAIVGCNSSTIQNSLI